jgi:aspartyl-tRNA(Asn)/glutamyl-tRNA(Gln) amidotransferase subunit A
VPTEDAPSVARLRAAGAVLLGKLNMHEVAYGVTGDSSHFGPTRNPWDLSRVPGGSSGGSGAAVAAGLCAGATGSDTGGSIRIPAALCGIVGLKPTYGRIPTRGLIPLSYSLDHPGPMTRSVYDAGVMLQAMSGYDEEDPTTADEPVPIFTEDLDRGVHGLTVALDPEWCLTGAHPDVLAGLEATLETLSHAGANVVEVSLPRLAAANRAALDILNAEASGYHEERLKTRLADYRPDVGSRLQLGFDVRGIEYGHAIRLRSFLVRDFKRLFEGVDLFIAPAAGVPAPPIGTSKVEINGVEVSAREAIARFTRPFNFTGLPVLALPSGLSADGLPVGVQIAAACWNEALLLRVGRCLEGNRPWPSPPEPI